MRIMLESDHRYPASVGGGSGARMRDNLAKGLAELGHEVFYLLSDPPSAPLPEGVERITAPLRNADVWHLCNPGALGNEADAVGQPWVRTCHVDLRLWNQDLEQASDNWIFVSRSLAEVYGSDRCVLNGIDPEEFIYSENKEDYLLFVTGDLEFGRAKGVETAFELARQTKTKLVVAGSSPSRRLMRRYASWCEAHGAAYAGEIFGVPKARLFAKARALLFPSRMNEAFGLVMAESLMSGTPVICGDRGACPELITPEVGFVCGTEADYLQAIANVNRLSPRACRDFAESRFHYRRMAEGYLREYQKEIARTRPKSSQN